MLHAAVCSAHNQLCGSIAGNGVVHFVLHIRKKSLCQRGILIIVYAGCVNIGNFLIKTALTQTDFTDLFKQPLKVVLIEKCTVFHALAVNHISGNRVLLQNLRCPASELRCADRIDAISNGNDRIQIVVVGIIGFAV